MGLLQMSFAGAVLILVIVIIRAIAIKRLPKKTFLALWIIALIRLLLPFSIPSPFSIYSLISRNVSDAEISDTVTYEYQQPVYEAVLEGTQNTPAAVVPQALPESTSVSIWTLIWIIGMLALAGSFLISYWRCRLEFKTALPIHNDIITEWLSEHPSKRKIEIRQFSGILTPMTYGIFHPVILLPKNTDWENKQQLQYILFHEYVHICHYDTTLKFLTAIALCIHWFNPMVWVLYILFNRDIELACDECVIRRFGSDNRSAYARMLISMEERKNRFAPFCNNFSKNAIEERIESIMKTKKTSVITLVLAGIIVVGTAGVFATSLQDQKNEGNMDTVSEIKQTLTEFKAFSYNYLKCKAYMFGENLDTADSLTVDNMEYYRAISGDYTRYSDLMAAIDRYCSEDVISECNLKKYSYYEGDNDSLYIWKDADSSGGVMGSDAAYITSIEMLDDNSVKVNMVAWGDKEEWGYEDGDSLIPFEITMTSENDLWKIDECGLMEMDYITWLFNADDN